MMLRCKLYESRRGAHNAAVPPFPTQQLFVLGMYHDIFREGFCTLCWIESDGASNACRSNTDSYGI